MSQTTFANSKEARIGIELWLKYQHTDQEETAPNVSYIDALVLLVSWMLEGIEYERRFYIPAAVAPDICATCCACYGSAIGGRVRAGCYVCQDTRGDLYYPISYLAQKLALSDQEVEFVFAKVLRKSSSIKIHASKSEESITLKP